MKKQSDSIDLCNEVYNHFERSEKSRSLVSNYPSGFLVALEMKKAEKNKSLCHFKWYGIKN
ncbi:MAG: hypothetical protein H7Y27_04015 [Gemmatimonadaceae bacterium]|nr:hypothetical protein [Chitinophagaceae bacterium]